MCTCNRDLLSQCEESEAADGIRQKQDCHLHLRFALMSLALSACAGTPAASATVTSSPMTAPTSTATQEGLSSEWQRYTDAKFGFRAEVAADLTKSGPDPFNYEGVKILFMSSGAEHRWEQAYIYVDPAPPQSLCTSALTGEKVRVGPGLTGYQRFRESVPPPGGGGGGADTPHAGTPYMELFVVASGVLMQFQLTVRHQQPPIPLGMGRSGSIC